MTTPKVKCDECGYLGEYNSEIFGGLCQDCGQGRKCPKCKATKVTSIPSSTTDIDDEKGVWFGTKTKVPPHILKKHLKIRFICNECAYEW